VKNKRIRLAAAKRTVALLEKGEENFGGEQPGNVSRKAGVTKGQEERLINSRTFYPILLRRFLWQP
jgi:hypothetical protein